MTWRSSDISPGSPFSTSRVPPEGGGAGGGQRRVAPWPLARSSTIIAEETGLGGVQARGVTPRPRRRRLLFAPLAWREPTRGARHTRGRLVLKRRRRRLAAAARPWPWPRVWVGGLAARGGKLAPPRDCLTGGAGGGGGLGGGRRLRGQQVYARGSRLRSRANHCGGGGQCGGHARQRRTVECLLRRSISVLLMKEHHCAHRILSFFFSFFFRVCSATRPLRRARTCRLPRCYPSRSSTRRQAPHPPLTPPPPASPSPLRPQPASPPAVTSAPSPPLFSPFSFLFVSPCAAPLLFHGLGRAAAAE